LRAWLLAVGFLLNAGTAAAAPPAVCSVPGKVGDCVIFSFDWDKAAVPKYTIVVQENHIVHYWLGDGAYDELQMAKPSLTLSDATFKEIFTAIEPGILHDCETKARNIAQTGKKTVRWYDGDQYAECTFNYSENVRLNEIALTFMAVAETMQMGETLKHSLRYDRLGLDAEMDSLVDEVKRGDAIEAQNIAPILQLLVDDDRVMERVKRKAAHLLEGAGIAVKNYTPEPSAR
jgi:hypothetical protein